MIKKFDKEKLFMTVLMIALCLIFAVLFIYGLNSVLAMEGSFPPVILEEGKTPAPTNKKEALDFLNEVIDNALDKKPKFDTADNFEVDTDTLEISGSDELKNAMLYVVEDFDSELDSHFESVSTGFGEDFSNILNIPDFTVDDITDFSCDYIYYQCTNCGEESGEYKADCVLCGNVNEYIKKYRDEYSIMLKLKVSDKLLDGNFNRRTNDEAIALCGEPMKTVMNIDSLDILYEELRIIFNVERTTNKLKYLDYSKRMKVSSTVTFTDKYSSLGTVAASFIITENDSFRFTWPGLSLSATEKTVAPKGSDNLLATLTCTDPLSGVVTWTSSDESIVTVDSEGYFKATSKTGEAKVTASFEFNGEVFTDECVIKVKNSVESSKMSAKKIKLSVGEKYELRVKISPNNATVKTVTWYTENENVATVDENGIVTANAPGTVTVYSLTDDGYYKSSCEVTVQ